ncbi:MAG: hypothetical protein KatS3mg029_0913 [Saprospiraceae bacterium]|nr:MAG: hypothetical protein KatS3mg029_0913 [Saprospiraceae bacterium]
MIYFTHFSFRCFGSQFIALLLLLFGVLTLQAQQTWRYVPADAAIAVAFDFGNLGKKVSLEQLRRLDIVEDLLEKQLFPAAGEQQDRLRLLLENPKDLGLDLEQPVCFYMVEREGAMCFTFLIGVSDRTRLEQSLIFPTIEEDVGKVESVQGYQRLMQPDNSAALAWNDQVFALALVRKNFALAATEEPYDTEEYDYEEWEEVPHPEPYEEAPEPMEEQPSELETEEYQVPMDAHQPDVRPWLDVLMNRNFGNDLTKQPQFVAHLDQPADMRFWMDYDGFRKLFFQTAAASMARTADNTTRQVLDAMQHFNDLVYGNMRMYGHGSMENGLMQVQAWQYFDSRLAPFLEGVTQARTSRRLRKYILDDGQLFGYYHINIDNEALVEEGKALVHTLLRQMPEGGRLADAAFSTLGVFIDEQAIADLVKGEFLMYVSGMQWAPVKKKVYDYDEDFNYIEIDTVEFEQVPRICMLVPYGRRSQLGKFIELGEEAGVLVPDGKRYRLELPGIGWTMYLAMEKGMLILTNDEQLTSRYLRSGLPCKRRIGKAHIRALRRNSLNMYWDVENTFEAIAEQMVNESPQMADMFMRMANLLKSVEVTQGRFVKEGNYLRTESHVHLSDDKANFLLRVLQLANEFYLESKGAGRT